VQTSLLPTRRTRRAGGRKKRVVGREGGKEGEATYVVETGRSPAEEVYDGVLECLCVLR